MKAAVAIPASVSLAEALLYWLKLGFISFGGPAGQIAIMHTDLVEKRRWISEQRFLHALNYCMLLPGPEATQLAIYIGWLLHRTWGGIIAGVLFVLPSLLLLGTLAWVYLVYGDAPLIAGILYGIKPSVVAIVLAAAWRIGARALKNRWLIALACAAFIAIAILGVPFPAIVGAAALTGLIGGRLRPELFRLGQAHAGASTAHSGPAIIDDSTPTPAHARFTWGAMAATVGAGLLCGVGLLALLAWATDNTGTLTQMGWFFTKAALLTFGGAYAVLPYVYQGAVETFQWVTPAQMIDGLALGESTPGPLIMIVAFVGFIGAWTQAVFGAEHPLLAGMAGACVATFFTFLPSFIFILAGGPVVESTRDNVRLTAPLTAISAAVVGVIASLAVFFAEHVFRLRLAPADWDWIAMAIAVIASYALLRQRIGTIPLIAASGAIGLVISWTLG
ncbi:MAG TPA: chromate efflux transporter [Noviherbaspirillum sp.]|nr:chromate efflux transporter [Noviherbaspirillum sp.]